jgi:hypothetical protein
LSSISATIVQNSSSLRNDWDLGYLGLYFALTPQRFEAEIRSGNARGREQRFIPGGSSGKRVAPELPDHRRKS